MKDTIDARDRLTSGRNRERLDVIADILLTCGPGANKTRIKTEANLNDRVAKELLAAMTSTRLIELRMDDKSSYFHTTTEGVRFLRLYFELAAMLGSRTASSMDKRLVIDALTRW